MPSRMVHISEKGMRLERFMRIHFPDVPFGMLGKLMKKGRLTVDDSPATATQELQPGQRVEIAHRDREADRRADAATVSRRKATIDTVDKAFLDSITIAEDEDIIAFDKPSGLAVHPGSKITRDLDSMLVRMIGETGERPVLAHRLDKDTSGLIVAAKTKAMAVALGKAFAAHDVVKEYRAIVAGVPDLPGDGVIDIAIAKKDTPKGGRMVAVDPASPGAQAARTRVVVLDVGPQRAWSAVALFPETGRQHQLRVHMSLIGHPILGDALYGDVETASRLMLHAYRLRFKHPGKGWRDLEALPPPEFGER